MAATTSSRLPFVTLQGWIMLVPLYGLHALLGGWLVMRASRVTWPVVYLPGVLFGLYEAYITKVLWDPTWSKVEWHGRPAGCTSRRPRSSSCSGTRCSRSSCR